MTDSLPRTSIYFRALRISLTVGAVYDILLAAAMAFAPALLGSVLGVPTPSTPYGWVLAVVLTMLGAFYALAAYDPVAYRGNVLVAIAGRAAAGAVLLATAATYDDLGGFALPGLVDLLFAVVHAVCWWPSRPVLRS